ncbi:hypothetical protein BSKO_12958 [Bryopsis sp. KO-2023]|nr:hypothetical protein BSKO_12958 [Bryopsis sp. KO-2023]
MTSEREQRGSLPFDEHVVQEAWRVLCPAGKDVLTRSDVLRTWRVFDPSVTLDDVRVMVGPKGIELDDLINILKDKSPQGFDPVAEAFQFLDPEKSGFIDADTLKRVLSQVATGPSCTQIDSDDIRLLIEALDTDGDGRISFEEFAAIEIERYIPSTAEDSKSANP